MTEKRRALDKVGHVGLTEEVHDNHVILSVIKCNIQYQMDQGGAPTWGCSSLRLVILDTNTTAILLQNRLNTICKSIQITCAKQWLGKNYWVLLHTKPLDQFSKWPTYLNTRLIQYCTCRHTPPPMTELPVTPYLKKNRTKLS